jgi:hypothetical protein
MCIQEPVVSNARSRSSSTSSHVSSLSDEECGGHLDAAPLVPKSMRTRERFRMEDGGLDLSCGFRR